MSPHSPEDSGTLSPAPALRIARTADIPALHRLIDASVRALSRGYYSEAQIASGLRHVFGPDSALIADQTYFVIETDGVLAAAGGWSRRRTLYGGDQTKSGPDPLLDALTEPARIRAFFVDPRFARRGLARRLLEHCAAEAARDGFSALELMATLPGVPLYLALGFESLEHAAPLLADGVALPMIRMRRSLGVVERTH